MRISKIARVANATILGAIFAGMATLGIGLSVSPASAETAAPSVTFDSPPSPSVLAFQVYGLKFDQPVTGLTLDDFVISGSANCEATFVGLVMNRQWAELDLARCGVGTVQVTLKANSVDGVSAAGPVADLVSPVLTVQDAPIVDFPAATIVTRDEAELGAGEYFRVDFASPIGSPLSAAAIQAIGTANCKVGGYMVAPDGLSMSVSLESCQTGTVGIMLDARSVTNGDGSCCGPLAPVKSNLIEVKAFGPQPLAPNKGGPASPSVTPDHITGVVWFDLNQNHIQDANEPGLPGATVVLDNETTQKSGANGEYDFGPLTNPGVHSVSITLPASLWVVADSEGAADGAARVKFEASTGVGSWFAVAGDSFMSSTFTDASGNKTTEPVVVAWAGLDGIADTADDVFFTVSPNADGTYLLKNAPSGDYRVVMAGKDALKGTFTLTTMRYDSSLAFDNRRDVSVQYKDLAYTGGSPFDFGLLAFGLAALAGGAVLLRRVKRA